MISYPLNYIQLHCHLKTSCIRIIVASTGRIHVSWWWLSLLQMSVPFCMRMRHIVLRNHFSLVYHHSPDTSICNPKFKLIKEVRNTLVPNSGTKLWQKWWCRVQEKISRRFACIYTQCSSIFHKVRAINKGRSQRWSSSPFSSKRHWYRLSYACSTTCKFTLNRL